MHIIVGRFPVLGKDKNVDKMKSIIIIIVLFVIMLIGNWSMPSNVPISEESMWDVMLLLTHRSSDHINPFSTEPVGPCTTSMEVSEYRMERVKLHVESTIPNLPVGVVVGGPSVVNSVFKYEDEYNKIIPTN